MKAIICLFLCFFADLSINSMVAQQVSVSGVVLDYQTNKPLPFANIVYNSKNQGFITDIDGKFFIRDDSRIEFLKISYVGYASKLLSKEYVLKNKKLIVSLLEEPLNLAEVTVYPGENPAHRIIYKVLENKKLNNPNELQSFSYSSYNKMIVTAEPDHSQNLYPDTLDLNDSIPVDTSLINAKRFLDSQHLFLMESISERYYKKPGKTYEKVIASRVSGFKEATFVLLATQLQSFSFYDEMITLLDSRYVNPISEGFKNRYFFNIEDTSYTDSGDTLFSISFKPGRNKNFEGLKGIMNISSDRYAIQSVIAGPVENNGMIDLKITQKYDRIDGVHWFPVELNTDLVFSKFVEAKAGENSFKLIGIGKTYLTDIQINQKTDTIKFSSIQLEMEKTALVGNGTLWTTYRRDSLTTQEKKTYQVLDSIGKVQNLDLKLKMFMTISTGYIPFYFIDIYVLSLLDFNMFEGFRPGLGFRTNDKISDLFAISAYSAWGFKDNKWKFGSVLDFNLDKSKQVKLGLGYKSDVFESSGFWFFEDRLNFTSSEIYRDYLIRDMTYREEFSLSFAFRALKQVRIGISTNQARLMNTSSYRFYNNGEFDPAGKNYRVFETRVGLKFAPNEELASLSGEIFTLNPYHSPVLYFNFIKGHKLDKFEFDYLKIEAKMDWNFLTKSFGRSNMQIVCGKLFGDLPYFMQYNGHESYYDFTVEAANSFATMRMNEFLSDEFISFHFRQDFGSLLFKIDKFKPKIVFATSLGFGKLSNPGLHQNLVFRTMEKGYFESGLLINNIFRQLNIIGYGFGVYYRYGPYSFLDLSDNFAYKLTVTFEL